MAGSKYACGEALSSTHLNAVALRLRLDPWVKPSPKAHAYLTFGFALARANARMLLHVDAKRRSARNRVRTDTGHKALCPVSMSDV